METTIPSAYYTSRPAPEMVEKRDQTRRWWREAMHACELVSSVITLGELEEGTSEHVPIRIAMIRSLELLDVTPDVNQTARTYTLQKLMPSSPPTDVLHRALASHYNCDVLVTWNYRHLANERKLHHIRLVNAQLGLPVPVIASVSGVPEAVRRPLGQPAPKTPAGQIGRVAPFGCGRASA